MKKILLSIITIIISFGLRAQENKIESTGNVGIGTTSPSEKLEVNGGLRISNPTTNKSWRLIPNADNSFSIKETGFNGAFNISGNGGVNVNLMNLKNGKVGIGTNNPNSLLTLGYNNGSNQLAFKRADGNETFSMYLNQSGQIIFQNTSGGGDYDFRSNIAGQAMTSTLFIEGTNGNIGFGTSSPDFALDIEGNSEGIKLGDSAGNLLFRNNIGGANEIRSYGLALEIETRNTQDISFNSNNGNSKLMIIKGDGSGVGIGTTNPNGWKLAVNGKIRAKEIKVETGWSDFVFFDTYKLPTLQEVENHIQENGHLKDIPSAKEVEENGIFLGEMDSKLLQKIEELTLYTIQQQKEIEELKSLVKELVESKK